MTNLQAAIGVAQLERLKESVDKKRHIGSLYTELLAGISGIQLPLARTDFSDNIYWVYGVVLDDCVPFTAKEAMARLAKLGVGTRPFFWPMHEQPVFQKMNLFNGERYRFSERSARRGFYLPSGIALRDEQIEQAASALREILR